MGGNRNDNVTISNLVVNQNHKWLQQRISELNATIHKVTRKLIKLTLTFKNKPYFEEKKIKISWKSYDYAKVSKGTKHSLSIQAMCIHNSKEPNNSSHRVSSSVYRCKKFCMIFVTLLRIIGSVSMLKACTNLSKKALQIASLGLVASSMILKIQDPLAETLNL